MLSFIAANWVTGVVLLILGLCVFLAIRKLVKDKKEGIGSCGCKCSQCPHSACCQSRK